MSIIPLILTGKGTSEQDAANEVTDKYLMLVAGQSQGGLPLASTDGRSASAAKQVVGQILGRYVREDQTYKVTNNQYPASISSSAGNSGYVVTMRVDIVVRDKSQM